MEGRLLVLIHFAKKITFRKKEILVFLLLFHTVACKNQNIAIDFKIPNQLEKKPQEHGFLKMSSDFENYIYKHPYEHSLRINLGSAQRELFITVLERIFTNVHLKLPANQSGTTIVPELINFELSKPKETGFAYYECRFEYLISLINRKENKKHEISAYARLADSFNQERNIIAKLVSQCMRVVASKLEIYLIENYVAG